MENKTYDKDALKDHLNNRFHEVIIIDDVEKQDAAIKQFVKDNKLRFEVFSGTLGENLQSILRFERFDFADARRIIFEGLGETLDGVEQKVFELQNKLSPGPGTPDKRDRITPFVFGANVKKNLGKTTDEISEEIEKLCFRITEQTFLIVKEFETAK